MGNDFKNSYIVSGSIGQFNNWAWIPWLKIALKDKNIHVNTQKGYYLVFLFDEKMENVYLSLNQGWTFFNEKYKNIEVANQKVQGVSKKIRDIVSPNTGTNSVTKINLQTKGKFGRGYESSHIVGKHYQVGNIPGDKVLIEDLKEMLGLYNDLAAFMRNRTFEELNNELLLGVDDVFIEEDEEEDYQEISNKQDVDTAAENHVPHAQKKKPTLKTVDSKSYYPRDAKQAAIALTLADHKCEYDRTLPTFISKSSGKTYVEAHHLIPVKYYEDFEYSIDVPENIVALNPTIHRQIHHGNDEDKRDIIQKLFNERSEKLKQAGLEIALLDLVRMYGIS